MSGSAQVVACGAIPSALTHFVDAVMAHTSSLSDAQLRRYGQYALAAATLYYVSTTFQAVVPADAQYAVDAHLPQGYDRSVIAARLEHRRTKQRLGEYLQLQQLRDALRTETSREGKLQGWQTIFERTLAGLLAGAYAHSLTLSLFTMKNTVRVLVFVLRRREEAGDKKDSRRNGPIGKVKAWWTGGTQSMIMESLMERMNDQVEKQASPFANTGLDEEPVPDVPGAGNGGGVGISGSRSGPKMVGGRDAFVYSQMVSRELSAAALDGDEEAEDRGFNGDNDNDEDDAEGSGLLGGRPRNSSCVSNTSTAWTTAAIADAERLFSVKDILTTAVPRIVATATGVVQRVLARHPGKFTVAGSVSSRELRQLLVELCAEMERAACVAEWIYQSPLRPGSCQPSLARGGDCVTSFGSLPDQGRRGATSAPAAAALDGDDDGEDEEDIVHFPAGSTTMLGPDGRPVPKSSRPLTNGGLPGADTTDEAFMERMFGMDAGTGGLLSSSAEVRRAHREALRQELVVKQQVSGFFQELIYSASFAELCLQYAESTLADTLYAALNITGVKSYDKTTDSAKMLMVVASLEGHRQRALDTTEFEVQPSMKLFCEEILRSTCTHAK